jgi:hypothetical protein
LTGTYEPLIPPRGCLSFSIPVPDRAKGTAGQVVRMKNRRSVKPPIGAVTWTTRDRLLTKALDRLSELADPTDVTNLRVSMDKLLFWLGIGAAQKGAGSKPTASRHPVVSFVVGILGALLIAVGMFFLLVSQQ